MTTIVVSLFLIVALLAVLAIAGEILSDRLDGLNQTFPDFDDDDTAEGRHP